MPPDAEHKRSNLVHDNVIKSRVSGLTARHHACCADPRGLVPGERGGWGEECLRAEYGRRRHIPESDSCVPEEVPSAGNKGGGCDVTVKADDIEVGSRRSKPKQCLAPTLRTADLYEETARGRQKSVWGWGGGGGGGPLIQSASVGHK